MTQASSSALVTGASRGIGRAIALRLARDGFATTITWRSNADDSASVVEAIRALGGTARSAHLDLGDPTSIQELVKSSESQPFAPDVIVNNAGEIHDRLFMFQSDDELRRVIDVNLLGTMTLTRSFLRGMLLKRAGRIINIASVSGLLGNMGQTGYSAAKAGIIAFGRSLAREVGGYGVTVNTVAPGFIETEMLAKLPKGARDSALRAISLGRFGEAEEVAAVVGWLASAQASWVTGSVIRIDGGLAH